jgi:hypothetical protein
LRWVRMKEPRASICDFQGSFMARRVTLDKPSMC